MRQQPAQRCHAPCDTACVLCRVCVCRLSNVPDASEDVSVNAEAYDMAWVTHEEGHNILRFVHMIRFDAHNIYISIFA